MLQEIDAFLPIGEPKALFTAGNTNSKISRDNAGEILNSNFKKTGNAAKIHIKNSGQVSSYKEHHSTLHPSASATPRSSISHSRTSKVSLCPRSRSSARELSFPTFIP
jgi:hypothetical protein